MPGQTAAAGGPTWRDLSDKTDQLRDELSDKIDGLDGRLNEFRKGLTDQIGTLASGVSFLSVNQEHRVSILETTVQQNTEDIAALHADVTELKGAHNRALGHIGSWKLAGGIAGGAASLVIADIIAKAIG